MRNLGHFNKQDLADIWSDSKYQKMHYELLQLMLKFKLCYEIPSHKENYIAPQLLSLNQQKYTWNNNDDLFLRYKYKFMPKGILTRFIVEMHKSIYKELLWRSGVVLAKDSAFAEVREYYDEKEIRIRIIGNNKRDFMTTITDAIYKLNDSYERIKYDKLIPCNCSTCKNNSSPHFYKLQELKGRIAYQNIISAKLIPIDNGTNICKT